MRRVASVMVHLVSVLITSSFILSCSTGFSLSDPSSMPVAQNQNNSAPGNQTLKAQFTDELIHFNFASFDIIRKAKPVLERKVEWLKNNPGVVIIIEGHCDEKGTEAYNIALGEKRAEAVKSYLIDSGISGARLYSISYGSDRPLSLRKTESAFAKNRRVALVIQ